MIIDFKTAASRATKHTACGDSAHTHKHTRCRCIAFYEFGPNQSVSSLSSPSSTTTGVRFGREGMAGEVNRLSNSVNCSVGRWSPGHRSPAE
jgi:hypothetical protein